uniref:DNA helicase Pif1-like 2B domain-containing protein n=1 Tax=Chenopodium quinoa TaxID=63459 RepID=A0A803MS91_CHEQI
MLLNIIKGPTCFQDIRTVDGIICATYKETCYFLGLLDGDNEWNEVLKEAATWSNAPQLRELYVTILLFCEVSEPKTLWEEHWQNLSDDIQYRQRRRLGIEGLCLAEDEIQNYSLYEFEQILKRGNRSLKEFPGIPFPDMTHLEDIGNRMIMEEQNYDTCTLTQESNHLQRGDGKLPAIAKEGEDEPMWINIPDDLLIKAGEVSIEEMVECVYLDLLQEYTNPTYLQQRAILASKNDLVDKINDQILKMILGEEKVYKSANRVCPLTRTGVNVEALYPTEFLNTLQLPGIPNHELKLKVGCLVILLRNIDHSRGLCNGTRLIIVTRLEKRVIQAKVITGTHVGKKVPISRVEMSPSDTVAIHLKAEAISSKTMFCNDNK